MAAFILLGMLGVIVMAEALNKLYRAMPQASFLSPQMRLLELLKAVAWLLLALAAGGALMAPFFTPQETPKLREICMFAGVVVLIIRTRIKEG